MTEIDQNINEEEEFREFPEEEEPEEPVKEALYEEDKYVSLIYSNDQKNKCCKTQFSEKQFNVLPLRGRRTYKPKSLSPKKNPKQSDFEKRQEECANRQYTMKNLKAEREKNGIPPTVFATPSPPPPKTPKWEPKDEKKQKLKKKSSQGYRSLDPRGMEETPEPQEKTKKLYEWSFQHHIRFQNCNYNPPTEEELNNPKPEPKPKKMPIKVYSSEKTSELYTKRIERILKSLIGPRKVITPPRFHSILRKFGIRIELPDELKIPKSPPSSPSKKKNADATTPDPQPPVFNFEQYLSQLSAEGENYSAPRLGSALRDIALGTENQTPIQEALKKMILTGISNIEEVILLPELPQDN